MHAADGTGAFYIKTAATRLAEVQTVKQTDLQILMLPKITSFLLNSFTHVFHTILKCQYLLKENITDLRN